MTAVFGYFRQLSACRTVNNIQYIRELTLALGNINNLSPCFIPETATCQAYFVLK